MLPVIDLGDFKKTRSKIQVFDHRISTQAYTIAFVYPQSGNNCIVKGMSESVLTYINQHEPFCFYRLTYWHNKESRGLWLAADKLNLWISPKEINGRMKYTFSMKTKDGYMNEFLTVRTVPKKWLPIFDQATFGK